LFIRNPSGVAATSFLRISVRQWHWVSSAFCLAGMILFAITGITLNHASSIESTPQTITIEAELSAGLLALLSQKDDGPLPLAIRQWLAAQHSIATSAAVAEWEDEEVYLALPRPGGDAWLSIDRASGSLIYEATERGWISYFNDLHKGRNTGIAWQWFLDGFAVVCLIFCLSGLWLLTQYARQRPGTWPVTALGVLLPFIILILTVH
jgi:hypothetical protein